MEWLVIPFMILVIVGTTILVVKNDKSRIRKAVEEQGGELIDIDTTFDFVLHNFKYQVMFRTTEGKDALEKCRVSFFLGVIWDDKDSFLKWLVP
jgi:hypothetical protein